MRKVLLATTALVAMTGAAAAEVTVNGFYEFMYTSTNDDRTSTYDTMTDDSEIHVSYNDASDNGLGYGMTVELKTMSDGDNSTIDESSMYVSGDFGKITLGNNDGAAEDHAFFMGNTHSYGQYSGHQTVKGSGGTDLTVSNGVEYGVASDAIKVKYSSPSMSGFNFSYSIAGQSSASDSEDTEVGVGYSTDIGGVGISINAGAFDSGESTDTGETTFQNIVISNGDIAIGAAMSNSSTGTTKDIDTSALVVTYALNDDTSLSADYITSKNGVAGDKDELTGVGFGISYMVAPGLKLDLGHSSYELVEGSNSALNNDGSVTRASMKVSF
jgi:outer membrane protein OmpU